MKQGVRISNLLALLIILIILAVVAIPAVLNFMENSRVRNFINEANAIIRYAENAYAKSKIFDAEPVTCFTLEDLVTRETMDRIPRDTVGKVLVNPDDPSETRIWLHRNDLVINGSKERDVANYTSDDLLDSIPSDAEPFDECLEE